MVEGNDTVPSGFVTTEVGTGYAYIFWGSLAIADCHCDGLVQHGPGPVKLVETDPIVAPEVDDDPAEVLAGNVVVVVGAADDDDDPPAGAFPVVPT